MNAHVRDSKGATEPVTSPPLAPGSGLVQALAGRGERHLTIPEQIAQDMGVAIVNGELEDGTRVLEEELAGHYGVSRSPVREAIALLERRGLVRSVPRRGTRVVGQSLDVIADLFNMRAVLVGLAGRYVARRADPEVLAALRARLETMAVAADSKATTPLAFARMGADAAAVITHNCGADYLLQMLNDHAHGSGWGMIWSKRPLDFESLARRRGYADDFNRLADLIEAGADREVEQLLRRMVFDSRDAVLKAIVALRGGAINPVHCLNDVSDFSMA